MPRLQTCISTWFLLSLVCLPAFSQDAPPAIETAPPMAAEQRAQLLTTMADDIASGYLYPKGESRSR